MSNVADILKLLSKSHTEWHQDKTAWSEQQASEQHGLKASLDKIPRVKTALCQHSTATDQHAPNMYASKQHSIKKNTAQMSKQRSSDKITRR